MSKRIVLLGPHSCSEAGRRVTLWAAEVRSCVGGCSWSYCTRQKGAPSSVLHKATQEALAKKQTKTKQKGKQATNCALRVVFFLHLQTMRDEERALQNYHTSVQHRIQLVRQVIKHAADVIQNGGGSFFV